MPKLKAQAVDAYADFSSLPAPTVGIYEVAVTIDTGTLYLSDGVTWTAVGGSSGGNLDGGTASSVYGGVTAIDGGNA